LHMGMRPRRMQEWFGHAPAGVVVLEGTPEASIVESLTRVAMFAGPILARMGMAAAVRQTADRATKERDRLTSIIDSLPDPIVITNAANDIVVQNARAERLLNTRDSDSEGRRRAVERHLPGQHLIQDDAQGIDVGRRVEQQGKHLPLAGEWNCVGRARDKRLRPMLDASMERRYSASPGDFVTGGGLQVFHNFEPEDDARIMSVRDAFRNSVNLPFIRLMRDVVNYHLYREPESIGRILEDPADPRR